MPSRVFRLISSLLAALLLSLDWQGQAATLTSPNLDEQKALFRRPSDGIPFPPENPFTQEKYNLGRMLFFEPLLSGSGKTSCATCHNPALSWADGLPKAVGDKAKPLARRSPTLLNIAWLSILGWDGGFPGIEQMTFVPITGKNNMSLDEATAIKRLAARSSYVDAFRAAYSDGTITRARIENAIATYERTLVSGEAPFDRWISGDERAIDKAAKRGFVLFTGQAGCANCHSGWAFTDGSFADVGVGKEGDLGRAAWFPTSVKLQHAFKTPTLRDVARRGPYMHDGSLPSLAAVIDLYDRGGINRPSRAPEIKPLGLSPQQKSDLIAFLNTLTSATKAVSVPVLPR